MLRKNDEVNVLCNRDRRERAARRDLLQESSEKESKHKPTEKKVNTRNKQRLKL